MRITEHDTLDGLIDDMKRIAVTSQLDLADVVRSNAYKGNRIARDFAKQSAGQHGKHYPSAFSPESRTPLSWEYGPDASKPQGDMSFEFGSRNQKPHLDLAKSADIIGPQFAKDVGDAVDGWFWGAEA